MTKHSIVRSASAALMVLLLSVSASPAGALESPVAPDPGTVAEEGGAAEQQAPETDGEPGAGDPAAEPEAPGGETPAPSETPAPEPEGDPAPEAPAVREAPGHSAEADPEEQQPLTEAPEAIDVTGTVVVIPDEAEAITADALGGEPAEEPGVRPGTVLVATDQAGLVELDTTNSGGVLEAGSAFSGEVALPQPAIEAVEEQIAAEGELSTEEVAETAHEAAAAAGTALEATGTGIDAPVAEAAAVKSHPVDIRYMGGSAQATPSRSALQKIITDSGAFWKAQSNGAISSMPIASYSTLSPNGSRCDAAGLWNQAIFSMGWTNANDYLRSGRHLVVFVNQGCGDGVAGLGSIGSLHSGGVTWVNLGLSGEAGHLTNATAHELGHNLGLGHADARLCASPAVDSSTNSSGLPTATGCSDLEYGDLWNVMGISVLTEDGKIPALGLPQKKMLGVLASGQMREVRVDAGSSQTFTINAASASSGLRGLRVSTLSPGTTFFVEYRNGTGTDSGLPWSDGSTSWSVSGYPSPATGVRVLKGYDSGVAAGAKRSAVLSRWSNGRALQYLRAGDRITPYGGTARVVVQAASGSTARVTIQGPPFTDVPFGAKFFKEIDWMKSEGISTGTKTSRGPKYQPKSSVTREAMAAFLFRMEAPGNFKAPASSPFADVPTNHKFYKQIAWMREAGLSTGTVRNGKRYYDPSAGVTREAMAAFIYRLEDSNAKGPASSPFADVPRTHKFYKEIAWMRSAGLSTGTVRNGKRYYDPSSKVTREAMAAFLYRLKH
ncbi:S-layer homology domain-containing protein [Leucobacter massiliensis]|uniref:SLH domain-containing protein n=1 Tax=Leucobacter massiliensis TaxID=1686285 RepID=A0A2S9QKW7_9MICO|nr:S-layer homology domain-containing protein [Leucobacter massiliensis]PRI10222.1 hypothetical protein B4915_12490 [Leucobacter massiliensis]